VNEVNSPPALAPIGNKTVDEQTNLTFTAIATDPDVPSNTLTYTLDSGAPTGATIIGSTGIFNWTPTENQGPGVYSITVRVTDNAAANLSDAETFTVTVKEVNRPPVLAPIDNKTVDEESILAFTATATDPDVPDNALTFSLDDGAPSGVTIDSATGAFAWIPTEGQGPGVYTITVRVTDNGAPSLFDATTFSVTVDEVNRIPALAPIGDRVVNEGTTLTFTAGALDADFPANKLTFSLDAGAPGGASISGDNGVFTWTLAEAQGPGVYSITVRVTDNGAPNLSAAETITVAVSEVNEPPVLAPIGNKTIDEQTTLAFTASATDTDLPANALNFSLDPGAPSGATIDSGTGAFVWMPSEGQGPASYTITVRVTDNGTGNLSDAETITITVNEVNRPPVLDPIGGKTVDEEATLAFTATASDPDLPDNALTFSLDAGAPTGATINSNTGGFTWTPSEAQGFGVYTITVRVTDNGSPNLSTAETITITVNEVNRSPGLASIGPKTIDEQAMLAFTANATDPDLPLNALTFSLDSGAPDGATIDAGTGIFTWTPTEGQGPGNYTVAVRVTDNGTGNLFDAETITVTVNEVNKAPVLDPIGSKTIDEQFTLAFTATATDPDVPNNTLAFSLDPGAPDGASIDSATGAFAWMPTEAQGSGVYTITVRVTDNGTPTMSDAETITITVNEVNRLPVLDPIGHKIVDEQTLLTFTATASDPDLLSNTLAFSLASGAPTGATIDSGTGVFTWTPTEAQGSGLYTITVRVTDNGTPSMSDAKTFTITVNEVNQPPLLGPIGQQTVDEQTTLTFTATATDSDLPANALNFSLDTGAPAGASIDSSTGAFTWTPTEDQGPKTYTITVRVTDNGAGTLSDAETITVTVNEVNKAPVLDSIGNQVTDEGSTLTFTATATDPDLPGNTLTFNLDDDAPTGATIDSGTGDFTWTPTEAQGHGVYTITVRVADNGAPNISDAETFTITVNEVNRPPTLNPIGNQAVDEQKVLTFIATATDPDLPGNTLTFSLDAGAPTGTTIDSSTGAFTWMPTETQGTGAYSITVRVTDNGTPNMSATETITVIVGEVNRPPVLAAIGDRSIDEGLDLLFTATATDPDVPGNTLMFSLDAGAPDGASIDGSTGAFAWRPGEDQGPGVYSITVRVTDNGEGTLSDSETITVTVNEVNRLPVLDPIASTTIGEGTLLSFTASATDPDRPANTLTFSLDPGAPSGAAIVGNTGAFAWTPTELQGPGLYTITVSVTDNGTPPLSATQTFTASVDEANQPPVLAPIGNKSVDEQATLTFTASATDPDRPADTLKFSLDPGAPAGVSIDSSTGAFTWTPIEAQGPGTYTITVRVTDNGAGNLSDAETITVTVNEVNRPPVLDPIGGKSVDEETTLAFTATASDPDLPANTLAFGLDADAPTGATIDSSTGAFSWKPGEDRGFGVYSVTVRVSDNGALSTSETITVTVNEVNKAPALVPSGGKSVDEQALLAFTIVATDPDSPANTLTFGLDPGAPDGASIDSSTGAFSWTPTEAQGPNPYTVTVRVTDNGTPTLSVTDTFTVTVDEVNLPPVLAPIGDKTVDEGATLVFSATASDPDVPSSTLAYSLDPSAPSGAIINSGTGAFTWTPTETQGPNTYSITVRVTDNGAGVLSDAETITVTVNEVNQPPALTPIGDKVVDEGTTLTFTAVATDTDVPTNTLTFSLDAGAPSGASLDPVTGAFTWTPTEAQGPASYSLTIRVTDNRTPALSTAETITVTVNEGNRPPTLAAIANRTVNEGSLLTFTASATDPDLPANTLAFGLGSGAPAGAAIGANSGVFNWTPSEDQGPGTYAITVRVNDSGTPGLSDSRTFTVTVNEINLPPAIAPIAMQTVNEGMALTFTVSATDSDAPSNTFTYSLDPGTPVGASIGSGTGAFTWTPTEAQGSGVYAVVVRATDNGSPAMSTARTVIIIVNEVNGAPTLTPIGSRTVDEGTPLTFTAVATDTDTPANAVTFSLDAGAPAGASIDGSTGVFMWTPSEAQGPGVYTATVRVTDNGTPSQSTSEAVRITVNEVNQQPLLAPISNKTVARGSTLIFTASATDPDLPANTLTFSLDAGAPAGATIIGNTGVFSWTPGNDVSPGTYTATVRVADNASPPLSNARDVSINVYLDNSPPQASFSATPISGSWPLTVTFTNESFGQIDSQSWTFGDGATSALANPTHVYSAAGTYTVTLTVSGTLNGVDILTSSFNRTVTVYNPVVAAFSGSPTSGVAPLAVTFTNTSAGDYSSSSWSFGDGGTSADANPVHTYNTAGTYTVTLMTTGPGGANTITRTGYITVYAPALASFTATPTSGYQPLRVSFTNSSTGDVASYLWDFGDGTTSPLANPRHTFDPTGNITGVYTVTLTANGLGGTNTVTRTSYVTATLRPPDLTGTVKDPTAATVGSTFVELYTRDRSFSRSTNSLSDGSFVFDGLPINTYYLRAFAPSGSLYGDSLENAISYGGIPIERHVITLTNPIITGTVTAPDNVTPISQTVVSLHTADYMVSTQASVDSGGRFRLGLVPDGSYILEAYPATGSGLPYGRSAQVPITVTAQAALGVTSPVTLPLTGASVAGTVRDPDGTTPIAGAQVTLHSADWRTQARATTNSAGAFNFGQLAVGTYLVEADSPVSGYFRSTPQTVAVDLSRTNYYTVSLTAPNLTGVTVRPSGGITVAVPNARVTLRSAADATQSSTATSDNQGQFAFGLLTAGDYWLSAAAPFDAPDLVPPGTATVTIPASATITRTIAFGSAPMHLEGTIRRANGSAITDARVSATRTDGSGSASDTVDGDGRYLIDLSPGSWMVTIRPSGSAPNWVYDQSATMVTFPDVGREVTRTLSFTVTDAPSTVFGQLVKQDGTPPGTARVGFHTTAGLGNNQTVGDDGAFSVQLTPGTYNVDVWLADSSLAPPRVDPVVLGPGETRDLGSITVRSRNSRISGVVVDANGTGVSGIDVAGWLRAAEGAAGRWSSTTSVADGVFNLNVVSGTWEINALPAIGSRYVQNPTPARVAVGEGETLRGVTIVLGTAESEIKGSIVDASSSLLTGLSGYATATSTSGARSRGAPIEGGTFTLRLPADTYNIAVQLPSGAEYTVEGRLGVTVAPGDSTSIALTGTPIQRWIKGSLIYSGTPLSGLRANVFASGAGGEASTQVDPTTGEYVLRVSSGTWYMNAWVDPATGYTLAPLGNNAVSTSEVVTSTFDFTLSPANGKLWGIVTAPVPGGTSVRLGGARIEARDTSPSGRDRPPYGVDTDANGVYTITVPAGTYVVNAYAPADRGYLPPPAARLTVDNGGTTRNDVAFQYPAANIIGTVSLPGSPVSSGLVRGYSLNGAQAHTDVSTNGTFALSVTANDTWYLQAVYEAGTTLYQSPMYTMTVVPGPNALDMVLSSTPIVMPESASVTFEASAMQVLVLSDGTEVRIPAGALAASGLVTVRAMPRGAVALNATARPIGLAYDLLALDSDGATISRFRQNVTIVLRYTDEQLGALGIAEDDVLPSYWDGATGTWRTVPNVIQNREANTLTVYTDHFSSWTITGGTAPTYLGDSTLTSSLEYVAPNQPFTYTLALVNSGTGDAIDVLLTDTLPSQISLVPGSATATFGTVTTGSGEVRWSGTVSGSQSVTVTFGVTLNPGVSSGQVITNSAIIAEETGAVITASNTITAIVPSMVNSTKTASTATPVAGYPLTYTVVLSNTGAGDAIGARLTDTIPAELTYATGTLAATSPTATYITESKQVRWTGNISAGQSVTVTYRATVNYPVVTGTLATNVAYIDDGNLVVTTRSVTSTISSAPDLSASAIAVSSDPAAPGQVLTYTITLTNGGTMNATGARVTDTLPGELTYVTGSVAATTGNASYYSPSSQVRWNGTVTVGTPVTITFAALVKQPLNDGTVIPNTAQIDDGTGTTVSRVVSTTVSSPNLSTSTMAVSNGSPRAEEVVTYTIAITNTGSGPAVAARMTDTLPASLTYVEGSKNATSGQTSLNGATLTWSGFVTQGQSVRVIFAARVASSATGGSVISNTASIDDGLGAVIPRAVNITVAASPDLRTSTKSASSSTARPGDLITYTIAIKNTGDGPTDGARMTDTLPSGLSYVTGSATATAPETPTFDGASVKWTGDVTPTGSVTITFAARVNPSTARGTSIANNAQIDDGVRRVVTVTASSTVIAPDLSGSTKSASTSTARVGDTITYTIAIVNSGNAPASTARMTDTLPAGVSYVANSATATSGTPTYEDGSVKWNGDIAAGGRVTVTFTARVNLSTTPGTQIANTAQIGDGVYQTITTQPATSTVNAPDLSGSTKSASASTARSGDIITYTIAIVNSSDAAATGVRMTDTLPSGLSYITNSATATAPETPVYDGTNIKWTGDVPANGRVTITFAAMVTASGGGTTITNEAKIRDDIGPEITRSASFTIGTYRLFLPAIQRLFTP
ncbi:MAG: tandem-95 repeat protein, partial [Chloroflexi bacterium]|nr:tandem-95 repeat protein [Chloroflexota bacterium]